jgi:alpha-L-fucosidase
VLRELSNACREAGLKFGVYVSPWDRNHPAYGTPEYNRVFVGMLEEVLGGYGAMFEVWFDGANGEGPNGKRQVYDWPAFHAVVKRLQPDAVIFSDGGPGVRWVGNERGQGSLTSWALIDRDRYAPGTPFSDDLGEGSRLGRDWVPPECDVSIRPGWFYRASEDSRVKPAATLFRLYEQSVGRNCLLLLNVPPDTRGLLADPDVTALAGMRRAIDQVYAVNLAAGARVRADASREGFEGARALDGDADTFWAAPEGVAHARLTLTLPAPVTFNRVVMQEPIVFGQRVGAFEVEAMTDGQWTRVGAGSTVGSKRILVVADTKTDQVRITIHEARGAPFLAEAGLHFAPPAQ